jgi:hypothetical protein
VRWVRLGDVADREDGVMDERVIDEEEEKPVPETA